MSKSPFLLLLLAGIAAAQTPDDFAWQWPLQTQGEDGAHTVVLDASVYARISRPDLRDLAVFNAEGQGVPFAPLAPEVTTSEQRTALSWLRVPAAAPGQPAESLSLRLSRDADGRLRDLELDSGPTTTTPAPSSDLLVDLGEDPPSVSSLRIGLDPKAALNVNLRVDVLGSDDLAQWQTLGSSLALVALYDNGLHIERLRLDFAGSQQRYLRLRLAEGQDWPPLASIESELLRTGTSQPDWQQVELEGTAVEGMSGSFEYRSAGPLPVQRLDLRLPLANTVASVQVESHDQLERASDSVEPGWRGVATFTAFRLGGDDTEVRHLAEDTGLNRDRVWRVRSLPALAQAPTLVLSYRPDRFVMLSQGSAPYRLLAGSARATRPDYPVQAALAAAGASRPSGWQPPVASLGEGRPAAGDSVLRADRGPDYRRWLLWGVLAIGAGLVLVVSLRVLKNPPAQG